MTDAEAEVARLRKAIAQMMLLGEYDLAGDYGQQIAEIGRVALDAPTTDEAIRREGQQTAPEVASIIYRRTGLVIGEEGD